MMNFDDASVRRLEQAIVNVETEMTAQAARLSRLDAECRTAQLVLESMEHALAELYEQRRACWG